MEILDFAFVLGKLKKTKRSGWIRENIANPESIAEHSFRVAILTLFLSKETTIDVDKALKMALIHDVGEAEIGDIVTARGKRQLKILKEKVIAERKGLLKILAIIGEEKYIELFDEFEANATTEARLVRQVDRLEMAIQALEYELEHKVNLQEFFDYADLHINDSNIKKILENIKNHRKTKI